MRMVGICLVAIGILAGMECCFAEPPVALPVEDSPVAAEAYVPGKLASGTLKFAGSRTMSQMSAVWADGFKHLHPDVQASFDFKGSETGLEGLAKNQATIGLVSRRLTDKDLESFSKANPGHKILEVNVAFDAIAIIVHPDNPIHQLTLEQLKTLFAQSDEAKGLKWGSVGLQGDWSERPVVRYTPDENSGTLNEFRNIVLGATGKFAASTSDSWHNHIVEKVSNDPSAIGIVSFTNAHSDKIRAVSLVDATGKGIPLQAQTVASEEYPLIRPLSVVVVIEEKGAKDPLTNEFLRYVLSRNGQDDVIKDGFQPLSRAALVEQYDHLGWNQAK